MEPRKGVRLLQCVGRVLRRHPAKVDALVIAPPIYRRVGGGLVEEGELSRVRQSLLKRPSRMLATFRGEPIGVCLKMFRLNPGGGGVEAFASRTCGGRCAFQGIAGRAKAKLAGEAGCFGVSGTR